MSGLHLYLPDFEAWLAPRRAELSTVETTVGGSPATVYEDPTGRVVAVAIHPDPTGAGASYHVYEGVAA